MPETNRPLFWRDARMPHVELRQVQDGRQVCYAPHTHVQWSMGAITAGQSTFQYGNKSFRVAAGDLVLINPERVHACNPIENQPWAYFMLYIDRRWLASLLHEAGIIDSGAWRDLPFDVVASPPFFAAFYDVAECLLGTAAVAEKARRLEDFLVEFIAAQAGNADEWPAVTAVPEPLALVANWLDSHCMEQVRLDALSARAGYSPSHFIRAFKAHYGLTPHAYQINRRVQLGQRALKQGATSAEAALDSGFSDQPHFQRLFKRLLAATPGDYSRPLLPQEQQATRRQKES